MQQQHLNISQAITADDLRQTISLLQKQLRPLLAFSLDLSLPAETGSWSPEALEQYLLDLYQSFSLSGEANYPAYNYQLGMLYWKKAGRENAAYYHLEKAWDQGLQFPALANLLNDLSGKLARRPLP